MCNHPQSVPECPKHSSERPRVSDTLLKALLAKVPAPRSCTWRSWLHCLPPWSGPCVREDGNLLPAARSSLPAMQYPIHRKRPLFFLLHLHSPHISMQVMARAENTVFLGVEVKETNLEILQWVSLTAKPLRLCAILFFLLHLHPPYISLQVMARAENTVFLRRC